MRTFLTSNVSSCPQLPSSSSSTPLLSLSPIRLVDCDERGKFQTDPEAASVLQFVKESVCGLARQGKSFINQIKSAALKGEDIIKGLGERVYTNGNPYGTAEDIVFSMPCRSKGDGDYELVKDVIFDDYLRSRIKKSEELLAKKKCVAHLMGEGIVVCDLPEDTMLPCRYKSSSGNWHATPLPRSPEYSAYKSLSDCCGSV